jgi:hypothetical protein
MDQVLWKNITDFNLDDPLSEYGFSIRLENENWWTVNFARDAILEYKKFMYLAAVSETMVSPSEIVDVVWHQHLIFTQSYEDFCSVLGKKVAHIPSTHNKRDFDKFKSAKERTQKLYTENFGTPPAGFWEYSDIYDPLSMPKSAFTVGAIASVGTLVLIPTIFVAYFCLRPLYVTINNPYFVFGYIAIIFTCIICLEFYNRSRLNAIISGWQKGAFVFNLSALELVYLRKNQIDDVIHGVVNQLILNDSISVAPDQTLAVNDLSGVKNPIEFCVLENIRVNPQIHYPSLLKLLTLKPAFNKTVRTLEGFKKYFNRSVQFVKLFTLNFIALSFVFLLGAVRLITGIVRERPVTIIAVIVIGCLILMIWFLHRLTVSIGSVMLPQFYKDSILPERSIDDDWEWEYFLMGSAVFATSFAPLASYAAGSDGGGGGDSGSSCGSSCGGGGSCGGCGGD